MKITGDVLGIGLTFVAIIACIVLVAVQKHEDFKEELDKGFEPIEEWFAYQDSALHEVLNFMDRQNKFNRLVIIHDSICEAELEALTGKDLKRP